MSFVTNHLLLHQSAVEETDDHQYQQEQAEAEQGEAQGVGDGLELLRRWFLDVLVEFTALFQSFVVLRTFFLEFFQVPAAGEHDPVQGELAGTEVVVEEVHHEQGHYRQEGLQAVGQGGQVEGPARQETAEEG